MQVEDDDVPKPKATMTTTGDNMDFWRQWEKQQKFDPYAPYYPFAPSYPPAPAPDVCPGCGWCRHCGGPGPMRITWTSPVTWSL